jgi:hypothetical protein
MVDIVAITDNIVLDSIFLDFNLDNIKQVIKKTMTLGIKAKKHIAIRAPISLVSSAFPLLIRLIIRIIIVDNKPAVNQTFDV